MTVFEQLQAHFQQAQEAIEGQPFPPPLHQRGKTVTARFLDVELHSHFQPLLCARTLCHVAHEALLRPCYPGTTIFEAPCFAFERAKTPQQAIYLDRLCRVVHAMNFVQQSPGHTLLYLNVSAHHLQAVSHSHGATFESLLELCGLSTRQVVLEILEAGVVDLSRLQQAVQDWRQRGFQIALDDFGCQHSNFDRLWKLTPDIVKLDRELIQHSSTNPRAAIILPKMIEMIHDLGAQVVCEGIETQAQHQLCIHAGSDLLQGFYYARPAPFLAEQAKWAAMQQQRT